MSPFLTTLTAEDFVLGAKTYKTFIKSFKREADSAEFTMLPILCSFHIVSKYLKLIQINNT